MESPLGWKSSAKSPGLHIPWCWGSQIQPPRLQLTNSHTRAPSGVTDSSSLVFVLAHSTLTSTQDTTFPKALVDTEGRVGREDVLPPCGRFLELQVLEPRIPVLQSRKVCGVLKATRENAISLGRATTKNSKEGGWRDNQFPEVNINLIHSLFFFPSVQSPNTLHTRNMGKGSNA